MSSAPAQQTMMGHSEASQSIYRFPSTTLYILPTVTLCDSTKAKMTLGLQFRPGFSNYHERRS